jgi:putative flavoprotein involved in K+ transport
VAMADFQNPKVPGFAAELDPQIIQIHVADYQNPDQLQDGGALVVGMGNSGAEIAIELVKNHRVRLSGKPSAVQPFRPDRLSGRILMPWSGRSFSTGC